MLGEKEYFRSVAADVLLFYMRSPNFHKRSIQISL